MDEILSNRIEFGKKIMRLRKTKKLTQSDLAKMIGTTQNNIYRIEKGKYSVGLDILIKIGKTFEKELEYH